MLSLELLSDSGIFTHIIDSISLPRNLTARSKLENWIAMRQQISLILRIQNGMSSANPFRYQQWRYNTICFCPSRDKLPHNEIIKSNRMAIKFHRSPNSKLAARKSTRWNVVTRCYSPIRTGNLPHSLFKKTINIHYQLRFRVPKTSRAHKIFATENGDLVVSFCTSLETDAKRKYQKPNKTKAIICNRRILRGSAMAWSEALIRPWIAFTMHWISRASPVLFSRVNNISILTWC